MPPARARPALTATPMGIGFDFGSFANRIPCLESLLAATDSKSKSNPCAVPREGVQSLPLPLPSRSAPNLPQVWVQGYALVFLCPFRPISPDAADGLSGPRLADTLCLYFRAVSKPPKVWVQSLPLRRQGARPAVPGSYDLFAFVDLFVALQNLSATAILQAWGRRKKMFAQFNSSQTRVSANAAEGASSSFLGESGRPALRTAGGR